MELLATPIEEPVFDGVEMPAEVVEVVEGGAVKEVVEELEVTTVDEVVEMFAVAVDKRSTSVVTPVVSDAFESKHKRKNQN